MYSIVVTDENYNSHIYYLTLKTQDIRTLYQIGIDINSFFNTMPTTEELCLFFSICLQSTNLSDGEKFIDDYLNEHSLEELMSVVPLFFAEVIGIEERAETDVDSVDNVPSELNAEPISVVKLLDDYLLACLELGLTEAEFNAMTIAEVKRFIETHEKRRLRELKEEAMIAYISCDLIGSSVARLLSKDAKFPTFVEAFNGLFTKEEIKAIEEEKARQKREKFIEQFKAMAKAHNDKIDLMEEQNKQE